ncbi:MAG: GTPase Era [Chloroflexi bacterium]|nr:GTPase Era [Chloroflexota bacterium]
MTGPFHSGYVAIVGRANVGKSTLLNAMLGQKLAIVSAKPHTTRIKLLGVLNGEDFQAALLDTPGFLRRGRDQLDAAMSRQMASALADADVALLVVEPRPPGDVERLLVDQIAASGTPVLLAVNKIDGIAKRKLLPVIEAYTVLHAFTDIVPVSALEKDGVDVLLDALTERLPAQEAIFAPDVLTDRPVSLLCADIIQEKVFQLYEQEIPYDVAVEIEEYDERAEGQADHLRATVYVDTPSQKRLLIGAGGQALKEVGVQARADIEQLVGGPVYVELWVKVSPKWRRKAGFVQRMI